MALAKRISDPSYKENPIVRSLNALAFAWCEVITDQDFMCKALGQLASGTLDLSSNGSSGNSNFTRDQRFAIRDAWRAFLTKNRERLARGERVPLDDPSVTLSLTGSDIDPGNPSNGSPASSHSLRKPPSITPTYSPNSPNTVP